MKAYRNRYHSANFREASMRIRSKRLLQLLAIIDIYNTLVMVAADFLLPRGVPETVRTYHLSTSV